MNQVHSKKKTLNKSKYDNYMYNTITVNGFNPKCSKTFFAFFLLQKRRKKKNEKRNYIDNSTYPSFLLYRRQ